MSDNKKYYYLKLKESFFDSEEMKILESKKNGIEYQNLYLKLCLLSVKNEGKLAFKGSLPYDLNMLSTILRVSIDTIKVGLEMYSKLGLIDMMDSGTMYMSDIQSLIGHGSTEGERKAEYRNKIDIEKKLILGQCPGQIPPESESESESDINNTPSETVPKKKNKDKVFIRPSIQDVILYFTENGYRQDAAEKAFNYYDAGEWKDSNEKPVRNWKQKMIAVWFKDENKKPAELIPVKKPNIIHKTESELKATGESLDKFIKQIEDEKKVVCENI